MRGPAISTQWSRPWRSMAGPSGNGRPEATTVQSMPPVYSLPRGPGRCPPAPGIRRPSARGAAPPPPDAARVGGRLERVVALVEPAVDLVAVVVLPHPALA